jgi:predicted CopG family antitoxin
MTNRMHRTQILIEPDQHKALTNIARKQKRSVSEIIREILGQYLERRSEDVRWQGRMPVLERARELRKAIYEERDGRPIDLDLVEELRKIRQKRDSDILLREGSDQ